MFGEQPARIRVIGADLRLGTSQLRAQFATDIEIAQQRRPGQPGQPSTNARGQLLCGFSGKGQPEHRIGQHQSIGHHPDHPGGHGLGLSCARTGHHQRRPRRSRDHRSLFIGRRRQTECLRQPIRRHPTHDGASRPRDIAAAEAPAPTARSSRSLTFTPRPTPDTTVRPARSPTLTPQPPLDTTAGPARSPTLTLRPTPGAAALIVTAPMPLPESCLTISPRRNPASPASKPPRRSGRYAPSLFHLVDG